MPMESKTAVAAIEQPRADVPAAITPMQMLQIAVERGADIEQLGRLMDLQDRWQKNEAHKAFVSAMADFRAEAPEIVKNRTAHNSKYAALDQICDVVAPILSKYGLSHRWRIEQMEHDGIRVFCVITHKLGHSEEVFMSAKPDTSGSKNPIQAIGSTVTYLERYTLLASCGLAPRDADDDARHADGTSISEKQAADLEALAEEVGADKPAFLKYMRAASFNDIPVKEYQNALKALEAKRNKK